MSIKNNLPYNAIIRYFTTLFSVKNLVPGSGLKIYPVHVPGDWR
ncbi:hypothetical protein [Citrobacter koseri]|nr:hypothetical protein [Citrobacter koseri]